MYKNKFIKFKTRQEKLQGNRGFIDLNEIKPDTNDEVSKITDTLTQLNIQIHRYLDDSLDIWQEHIGVFVGSTDCNTMQYLSESDGDKFVKFMMTQKTFRLMMITKARLIKRRDFLTYQM